MAWYVKKTYFHESLFPEQILLLPIGQKVLEKSLISMIKKRPGKVLIFFLKSD